MQVDKKRIVIVIPVYKSSINPSEKTSLEQALKVLTDYDISFVIPESLSLQPTQLIPGNVSLKKTNVIRFPDRWFSSTLEYSKLLLSKQFYQVFDKYSFMLLYQLDAYVFHDDLQQWASKGYDYIGAPWTEAVEQHFFQSMYKGNLKALCQFLRLINRSFFGKKDYAIGNGGLSLRNIKKSIRALNILAFLAKRWRINEDIFWSMAVPLFYPFFKVPNKREAFSFSFEDEPRKLLEMNGNKLPFGCHAWEKYSPEFWEKHISVVN